MAKFVATDYNVTINGASFSNSLAAVTLDITSEEQETTAFGDGFRTRIGGLKDGSITLDFHQDFGASSVDATLFPLIGTQANQRNRFSNQPFIYRACIGYPIPAIRV